MNLGISICAICQKKNTLCKYLYLPYTEVVRMFMHLAKKQLHELSSLSTIAWKKLLSQPGIIYWSWNNFAISLHHTTALMLSESSQWPLCPCHLFPLLKKENPGTGLFSGAVEVRLMRGALYLTAAYFYGTETNGSHAKNHCSKEGRG